MENIETSLQLDRDQFFMPDYCILWECAHHSPNKQQTFSSEFDWVDHWKKYHREVLDCFLKANPACLTFLGMEKYPVDNYNYVYFDGRAAMAHYEEDHNPLRSMSFPEAEDIANDTDWDDDKEEVLEEDAKVKMGSLDPMFNLAMDICPSYYKREFEFELCNNRPNALDEAVDREILQ